uniref:Uncharacterized protein n=1 Tax=Arundo donax TaxID=35708 RepID=A0A0A8YF30_ARUDO
MSSNMLDKCSDELVNGLFPHIQALSPAQ